MATEWSDVFSHTISGITIIVSRAFDYHKPIYSVKSGIIKDTDDGGKFLSPYIPMLRKMGLEPGIHELQFELDDVMRALGTCAKEFIKEDMQREFDSMIEFRQQREQSRYGTSGNAMKVTGKTQKKKDKIQAAKEGSSPDSSKQESKEE